nr:PREDICTED: uncharacterized protein K02A2.6-like isoform X1 [Bemisia tabaci]
MKRCAICITFQVTNFFSPLPSRRCAADKFIHGVLDDDIRDEIITKQPDQFEEALKIAQALEASQEASSHLKPNQPATVHKFYDSKPKVKKKQSSNFRSKSQHRSNQGNKPNFSSDKQSSTQPNQRKFINVSCRSCNVEHERRNCRYRRSRCNYCKHVGHLLEVCGKKPTNNINFQETEYPDTGISYFGASIHKVSSTDESILNAPPPPTFLEVKINGQLIKMELDTGGACSVIGIHTFKKLLPNTPLHPTTRPFFSFTKEPFKCLGYAKVKVQFKNKTKFLNLFVVDFPCDSIFGREWIVHFAEFLSFDKLYSVKQVQTSNPHLTPNVQHRLQILLQKHHQIFDETAGTLEGPPEKWHLDKDAKPVFARARPLPYTMREAYAQNIEKKLLSGHYKKVTHSRWASPTHVVVKNGKLRITGDYKSTVNPQLIADEYPIPKVEEVFHGMKDAKVFCKLDVTDAFMHLVCDDESCELMTLNTPTHGLIRPTRAQYGLTPVPAVWQRRLHSHLQDIEGATNFFDDILLYASSVEEMFLILAKVLDRLEKIGIKLNRPKCQFFLDSVEFLGHRIDQHGLHKLDKHVNAIVNAEKPQNADELRTFLGKVTYYHSFIPDLSTITHPLREILKHKIFSWTQEGLAAFNKLKEILISDQVLTPYDPKLPITLAVDASPFALGAVLSHSLPDETERPISYASKALNNVEKRYPQVDREALAIVWGVKRFFEYLYGRKFTLYTDNKPVSHIFAPNALLPKFTLSRCANYASYLSNFNYDIKFRRSTQNCNADYLSRIHSFSVPSSSFDDFDIFILNQIELLPVTSQLIAAETRKDPQLSPILLAIQQGKDLTSLGYTGRQAEYTQACDCLLWGHRLVIPAKLQKRILEELHLAHSGITKMKSLARSIVYWPNIDQDIEQLAKTCEACLSHSKAPPKFSHPWEYPTAPWERIHIDYAGPICGKYLLIVVDAYSKWLQVFPSQSMTSEATCKLLSNTFSLFGAPVTVVSDNGPAFVSNHFQQFLKSQGILFHKKIAPYHPATNGQAERAVQTVKNSLKYMAATIHTLQDSLNTIVQRYNRTPHQATGQPPSLLFIGRTTRTRLDAMHPNLKIMVNQRQDNSFPKKLRSFRINQEVMFRSYNSPKPWLRGVISAKLGALHYLVKYKNQEHKRHIDQLLSCGITLDHPSPSNCNTDVPNAADATTRKRVKFFPVSNATSSPQPESTFIQTSPLVFSDRSNSTPCTTSHDEISNSAIQSSPKNSSIQSSPKNSSIESSPKNSSIQSSSRNLSIQSSPGNLSTQPQSTSNQPSQKGSPTQSTSDSSSSPDVSPQHLKSPTSQHAESSSQSINVTPKNVPISKPNKGRGRGVSKATKKQFSVKPGVSTFGRIVKPKEPYSPE